MLSDSLFMHCSIISLALMIYRLSDRSIVFELLSPYKTTFFNLLFTHQTIHPLQQNSGQEWYRIASKRVQQCRTNSLLKNQV